MHGFSLFLELKCSARRAMPLSHEHLEYVIYRKFSRDSDRSSKSLIAPTGWATFSLFLGRTSVSFFRNGFKCRLSGSAPSQIPLFIPRLSTQPVYSSLGRRMPSLLVEPQDRLGELAVAQSFSDQEGVHTLLTTTLKAEVLLADGCCIRQGLSHQRTPGWLLQENWAGHDMASSRASPGSLPISLWAQHRRSNDG